MRNKPELAGWVNALLARRPARVVTVAVAKRLARIVRAIMSKAALSASGPTGSPEPVWIRRSVGPFRLGVGPEEFGEGDDDVMATGRQTED